MVNAELLGQHTHRTSSGTGIHIAHRDGAYLARFRFEGKQVGPTLGRSKEEAQLELLRLLNEVENGTFLPPADPEAKRRKRRTRPIPRLTIPELIQDYLTERRRVLGASSTKDYANRLAHVEAFVEQPAIKRRCPLASSISGEPAFSTDLRAFLLRREVSRNGHPNAQRRPMDPRGVRNVLEAFRDCLNWAVKNDVRKLPLDFMQPITREVIGPKPSKDPLRGAPIDQELRLRLVQAADAYQLVTLAPQFILPLRPEQIAGLLVSEINWTQRTLWFGERFRGHDFTKSKTTFTVPFPLQWMPLFKCLCRERTEGPVFLRRTVFDGRRTPSVVPSDRRDLERVVVEEVAAASARNQGARHDAKKVCRDILARAGGVTPDSLRQEFLKLVSAAGLEGRYVYYDLRASVVSDMEEAGISEAKQRYLMGQNKLAGGSLNEYVGLTIQGVRKSMDGFWGSCSQLVSAVVDRGKELRLW